MTEGHLYRIARVDAPQLIVLVQQLFGGQPCWTFGGAALWDFKPLGAVYPSDDKPHNLRPIEKLSSAAAFTDKHVKGDFGHAFAEPAEVRWKRIGQTGYDVLILTEQRLAYRDGVYGLVDPAADDASPSDATELWIETTDPENGQLKRHIWTTRAGDKLAVQQDGGRTALSYITYHGPGGVVQFVRYRYEEGHR